MKTDKISSDDVVHFTPGEFDILNLRGSEKRLTERAAERGPFGFGGGDEGAPAAKAVVLPTRSGTAEAVS